MSEIRKTPAIRFKGFTDDWELFKLGDIGTFKSNGVDKLSKPNETPVNLLNYMDVYNRREISNSNASELMQVTAKQSQLIENNVLKNDVFFTPTSETPDDIGRVYVIEETLNNTVYSYHLMRYRPNNGVFYPNFPNYSLMTNHVRDQFFISAKGVQRYVISKADFEAIENYIPKYTEQAKIGEMFRSIDSLITLHQRKYEKIQQVKKALLENMFPKEGEVVPKIRFKGFTDDWEQCKLGQLGFYISDGNYGELYPKSDQLINQGIPFIRVNNIKDGYLSDKDLIFISEKLHETLQSGHLETNDILITNRGQIGLVAYVEKSFNNANINAQICLIRTKEIMYSKYLHQFLQTSISQSEISAFQTGSALKQLPRARLNDLTINFSKNMTEQKAIGDMLFSIDNLITLHQRKYEKLQNIKKALLQKMFV